MKNNLEIITGHLEQVISGEATPSFRSYEFESLLHTISLVAGGDNKIIFESIGRRTVSLLLDRLSASMNAEREIAILIDNSRPLC